MDTKQIHPCECKEYNGEQCYNCLNGAHDLCGACKKKRSKRVGLTLVFNASDMGKMGAKKRWKGSTKAQRKKEMSRVAKIRWDAERIAEAAREQARIFREGLGR